MFEKSIEIEYLKDTQRSINESIKSLQNELISVNGKLIENEICPECHSVLKEIEEEIFELKIKYNTCLECGSRFMI